MVELRNELNQGRVGGHDGAQMIKSMGRNSSWVGCAKGIDFSQMGKSKRAIKGVAFQGLGFRMEKESASVDAVRSSAKGTRRPALVGGETLAKRLNRRQVGLLCAKRLRGATK